MIIMFPFNLQRNIVQLDRQISLLENECKNMEMEKKKKSNKLESMHSPCNKNSNLRIKAPTVRLTLKNNDCSKRLKKFTPSFSSIQQSSGSGPCHCSKTLSESSDAGVGRKTKLYGLKPKVSICSCQMFESPRFNLRKEDTCVKCACCNETTTSDLCIGDCINEKRGDHVLWKEFLIPNPGGTIEVTVMQKSHNGKENSPVSLTSPNKNLGCLENEKKIDFENCKCQIKGQKWSEILSEECGKKKELNCTKRKIKIDEIKKVCQKLNLKSSKRCEENLPCLNHNNTTQATHKESFEVPLKLSAQLAELSRRPLEINRNKYEKETQCSLEICCKKQILTELRDPLKIFWLLFSQSQQLPGESQKLSVDSDTFTEHRETPEEKNNSGCKASGQNETNNINVVKHHYETLLKEKSVLTEELVAKDNEIATMKKREEEYLSLIANLKTSLEKSKMNAREGIIAVRDIKIIKNKLIEQMKVSEALKKNHLTLQKVIEQCALESDELKTQLKIFKLEAQKHEVLMAGKEAEISRYRDEIQNFHRSISDHLASLKSNAQEVNAEKILEAIMQQSQIFAETDIESVLEKEQKDSSKTQNVLMHSSPTSSKTSVVNSSWKQISSIHDQDQNKTSSDVIYLNDEGNEKNFFQIFGEKSLTEIITIKKSKENSNEKLTEKKEVKKSSSFSSCISLHDYQNGERSTSPDSLLSKETLLSDEGKSEEEEEKSNRPPINKTQNAIDELLNNMKVQFSKEIFDTSLPSCSTEDFLDISKIISIPPS